jgi:hypothetical protein
MKATISDYELYLYFSYLPKFSEASLQWLNCDFENDFGKGVDKEAWWVSEGVKAFKETMKAEIASTNVNATHILPLSGGLDSRAILGGLLENLPKSQIVAATYGIPGTWDLEIAQTITREFGIRHEVFNLQDEKWEIDQLLASATRLKNPVSVHQSHVRQKINNHFGSDCVYWSGLMGDSLAGSDLPKTPSQDKTEAVRRHINLYPTHHYKDQIFQEKIITKAVSECSWDRIKQTKYTLDQQLDFGVRQRLLTQQIVLFNGFIFKTPFLSSLWTNFISNVPCQWFQDKHLYKRVIRESFQELWKLPSGSTFGRPISASKFEIFLGRVIAKLKPYIVPKDPYRSHPRTNYINWTESLRHKGNLQSSVRETLESLKHRAIFRNAELDTWWLDHLNRKKDYTVLLMNLSSLELLLQAGKF